MSRVSGFFPILYFDRGYNLEYNIANKETNFEGSFLNHILCVHENEV